MIITYCKPECSETKIYAFYLKYFAKFLHRSTSLTQNAVEVSDTFLHFVHKIINLKEKTSKINLVSRGYFRNWGQRLEDTKNSTFHYKKS